MSENELSLEVISALKGIVLESQAEGLLYLLTPVPDWFIALYPGAAHRTNAYLSPSISPFLENFLFDAELVWDGTLAQHHGSGFWTETADDGTEHHLRAFALCLKQRKLIFIEEVGAVFAANQAILQRAREGLLHIHTLQRAEQQARESEAALQRARDMAVETARLKSEFLANMSHEIRTPLNGIIGLADLLLETEHPAEQAGYAQTIQSSAACLLHIVNDILDFSKIEAGKLELESVQFAPRDLVASIAKLFQRQAKAKNISLTTSVAADVPKILCGDPNRLRQVLTNLVGNALKFTEQGQVLVRVLAQAQNDSHSTLYCAVEDSGPGVDEATQARLFQPFTQADGSTARRYGGTGLGLAISKQLVELMGGQIGVGSLPEKGAKFCFTVRLDHPAKEGPPGTACDEDEPETVDVETPEDFSLVLQPPTLADLQPAVAARILLVEDNAVNRHIAQKHLAYLGYEADLAYDGHAALDAFRRKNYDLIFMDCQMSGCDGFAATAAIRRLENAERHTPVVALTAYARPGDRERCLAAGMDDYVAKPLRRSDLAGMLERWLPSAPASPTGSAAGHNELTQESIEAALGWTQREDPVMFREILQLFQSETGQRLALLRTALDNGRLPEIAEISHTLRGSCGALGLLSLSEICLAVEDAAHNNEIIRIKALLSECEKAVAQSLAAVSAWL